MPAYEMLNKEQVDFSDQDWHTYGKKLDSMGYDNYIVGFQYVPEQPSGVKPLWRDGQLGEANWCAYDKRKRILETKIPENSIVSRIVILYNKHSIRLFGIQFYDKLGVLLLAAGLTKPPFSFAGRHEIILKPGERLLGAMSVMENI